MKEKKRFKSRTNSEDDHNVLNYDKKLYDGCDEIEDDEID